MCITTFTRKELENLILLTLRLKNGISAFHYRFTEVSTIFSKTDMKNNKFRPINIVDIIIELLELL
jgi:hypothetical protein